MTSHFIPIICKRVKMEIEFGNDVAVQSDGGKKTDLKEQIWDRSFCRVTNTHL